MRGGEPRRWSLAFLDRHGRAWVENYAERRRVDVASLRRWLCRVNAEQGGLLTTKEADEMAHAAGLHPFFVWPDWCDPPFFGCEHDDLWVALEDAV